MWRAPAGPPDRLATDNGSATTLTEFMTDDGGDDFPGREFRDRLRSDHLRNLFDYWVTKLRGRAMPQRADIDPVEIPALLPYVLLFDVEHAPERFRVRLVGTHVTATRGRDDTGKYLDTAHDPETYAVLAEALRRPVVTGQPAHSNRGVYFDAARDFMDYEAIHLPLSSDGARVDMLLSGVLFLSRRAG